MNINYGRKDSKGEIKRNSGVVLRKKIGGGGLAPSLLKILFFPLLEYKYI